MSKDHTTASDPIVFSFYDTASVRAHVHTHALPSPDIFFSTVVDNSSGFAGSEAPGSPAEVAARHAAGFLNPSASGGSESSGQQQRWHRGRLGKLRWNAGRSSSSDTPVSWSVGLFLVWSTSGRDLQYVD